MTDVSVFRKHRSRAVPAFCLVAVLASVRAGEPAFSPDLFPGVAGKSEADIRLAGVAALNPGRILDHDPLPPAPVVPEMRKTLVAKLPRGGDYVRLYGWDSKSLASRAGKSPLIVDVRYLATAPADLEACLSFGSDLGGSVSVSFAGSYSGRSEAARPNLLGKGVLTDETTSSAPVIVIVNRKTSGPLEAVLASLQAAGKIAVVGSNTAGMTGAYRKSGDKWMLTGEVKPDDGVSLVGVGLKPRFFVKTVPEDEFLAWQIVERGQPLSAVLKRDGAGATSSAAKAGGEAAKAGEAEGGDIALQRAQEILAAFAVLGAEGK